MCLKQHRLPFRLYIFYSYQRDWAYAPNDWNKSCTFRTSSPKALIHHTSPFHPHLMCVSIHQTLSPSPSSHVCQSTKLLPFTSISCVSQSTKLLHFTPIWFMWESIHKTLLLHLNLMCESMHQTPPFHPHLMCKSIHQTPPFHPHLMCEWIHQTLPFTPISCVSQSTKLLPFTPISCVSQSTKLFHSPPSHVWVNPPHSSLSPPSHVWVNPPNSSLSPPSYTRVSPPNSSPFTLISCECESIHKLLSFTPISCVSQSTKLLPFTPISFMCESIHQTLPFTPISCVSQTQCKYYIKAGTESQSKNTVYPDMHHFFPFPIYRYDYASEPVNPCMWVWVHGKLSWRDFLYWPNNWSHFNKAVKTFSHLASQASIYMFIILSVKIHRCISSLYFIKSFSASKYKVRAC